ncbi:hypothetical protein DUNSADRAFT_3688 [Dunaliella salina]|uniref:UmuC domain-containing protein n=1 Tax=Dunaliella salina TaxID=3046 RepID=A0ABQ7GTI9_DUNSA|nr:hypothetical protein DUNSADRAFT_3688 [Dunaliella salina]|eukprot:KAF5837911.1 hypothetical protein DUNSADRAFT_3688 [Dunaliella salina]
MDPSLCASRQILHIDLDGFYAQVEQKRVGLDESFPLAVLQWQGIIAINYAAKGRGVNRFMKIPEAKAVCPDLVFVHVRTIGGGPAAGLAETAPTKGMPGHDGEVRGNATLPSASPQAIADSMADVPGNAAAAVGEAMALAAAGEGGNAALENTGLRCVAKACLQRYRVASSEIFQVLERNLSHNAVMEKGGLDEVYLDVTPMVDAELKALGEGHNGQASEALVDLAQRAVQCSVLEGGVQVDLEHEGDRRLVVGELMGCLVDPACGYTCSAGIAANKLVAKIGSARNKPAQQTLVLPRAVNGLMQGIPLGKIKGLGGKLGAALQELCSAEGHKFPGMDDHVLGREQDRVQGKAGDVQQAPWEVLLRAAGTTERAQWVFNIVRGIDDEAVKPKGLIKSLNSCKSFGATSNRNEITRWLGVLSDELAERCVEDEWEHRRRPKSLGVRCSDPLPCTRLALAATDFHTAPVEGASAITSFFAPSQANNSRRAFPQSPHRPHSSTPVTLESAPGRAPTWLHHLPSANGSAQPCTPPAKIQPHRHLQEPPWQQQQQQQQQQVAHSHRMVQGKKEPLWGGVLLPPNDEGCRNVGNLEQQQQQQQQQEQPQANARKHHHLEQQCQHQHQHQPPPPQQQQQQQQQQGQQGQPHANARKHHLDYLLTPSKRLRLEQKQQQQQQQQGQQQHLQSLQSLLGECSVSQEVGDTCDQSDGQQQWQQQQQQQEGGGVCPRQLGDLLGVPTEQPQQQRQQLQQQPHQQQQRQPHQQQQQQQPQQQLQQPPNVRECLHSILGDPNIPSAAESLDRAAGTPPAGAAAAAAGVRAAGVHAAQLIRPGASGSLLSAAGPVARASQNFIEESAGRNAHPADPAVCDFIEGSGGKDTNLADPAACDFIEESGGRDANPTGFAVSASQDFIEEMEGGDSDPAQGCTTAGGREEQQMEQAAGERKSGWQEQQVEGMDVDPAQGSMKPSEQPLHGSRQSQHIADSCHLWGEAGLALGGAAHLEDAASPDSTPVLSDEPRPSHFLATGLWSPGELKREQQREQRRRVLQQEREKREQEEREQEKREQENREQQMEQEKREQEKRDQLEQQRQEQHEQGARRAQPQEQSQEPTDEERLLASVSIKEQQQIMRDLELQRLQRSGASRRGGSSQALGSRRGKGSASKKGGGGNSRGKGGKGKGGLGDKKQTSLLSLFQKQA